MFVFIFISCPSPEWEKTCVSSANNTTNIAALHYSENCFHLVSLVRTLCLNIRNGFPTSPNSTRNRPSMIQKQQKRWDLLLLILLQDLFEDLTIFQDRMIEHNLMLPRCYSALTLKLTLLQSSQPDMISESCVFRERILLQTVFLMSKDNASQLWGKLRIYQENIHQPTQWVIHFPLAIWIFFSKY